MPAKAPKKSKTVKKTVSHSTPQPFFAEPMHLLIIGGVIVAFALVVSSFMTYGANVRW